MSFSEPLRRGDIAPNWMLNDSNGDAVMLYNATKGTSHCVLLFWATWCNQCASLLPKLNELAKAFPKTRFYVLNIWEDKDPVAYFEGKKLDLKLLLKAEAVATRYSINSTPAIYAIGNDNRISYVNLAQDNRDPIQDLASLFSEPLPPENTP